MTPHSRAPRRVRRTAPSRQNSGEAAFTLADPDGNLFDLLDASDASAVSVPGRLPLPAIRSQGPRETVSEALRRQAFKELKQQAPRSPARSARRHRQFVFCNKFSKVLPSASFQAIRVAELA